MLGRSFLIWLFAASVALAQSYPSPTYNNTTVNGNFYTPSKTGYFYGNGASAASFATTIPTSVLTGTFPGTSIPFTQAGTGAVTSNVNAKLLTLHLSPTDYGAVTNTIGFSDGAVNASSTAFTSASATFTNADVNKTIRISGAGSAGATFETTISAYVSAHAVTLAAAAVTTVSGKIFYYGTDDTTAWQAAVNQCQATNGRVEASPGTSITSSPLSFSGSCQMVGGGGNATVIQPSVAIDGIDVNTNLPVVFEQFGIIYVGAANSGKFAISLTGPTGAGNSQSIFRDLVIRNASTCFTTVAAFAWNIDNLKCLNYSSAGIIVAETGDGGYGLGDAGDSKVTNSYIQGIPGTSTACVQWNSSGGFHFINNTCLSSFFGIYAVLAGGSNSGQTINTGQLFIGYNTFDGACATACMSFSRAGSVGSYGRIIITNNGMNLAHFGVSVNTGGSPWIEAMIITNNYWYDDGSASNYVFYIDNVRELLVAYNVAMATVSTNTFIATLSNVANAVIGPNMKGNVGTTTQTWAANSISGTNVTTIAPN